MARKPKAVRPGAEGKTQAERFIETARRIGVDETGEAFERAVETIIRNRRRAAPEKGAPEASAGKRGPRGAGKKP